MQIRKVDLTLILTSFNGSFYLLLLFLKLTVF